MVMMTVIMSWLLLVISVVSLPVRRSSLGPVRTQHRHTRLDGMQNEWRLRHLRHANVRDAKVLRRYAAFAILLRPFRRPKNLRRRVLGSAFSQLESGFAVLCQRILVRIVH
jgi:hypothetical protein